MKNLRPLVPMLFLVIFTWAARAEEPDPNPHYHSETESVSPAQDAVAKVKSQFEALRMEEADFKLSPGWDLPYTIKPIEQFFGKPLDIPVMAGNWADKLEKASDLSGLLAVAYGILEATPPSLPLKATADVSKVPVSLRQPVSLLLSAIKQAEPFLNQAVDSVPPDARQGFLSLNEWPDAKTGAIQQEISARRIKRQYDGMKSFSEADLAAAGRLVFMGIDEAIARMPKGAKIKKRIRWKTAHGDVLISGNGDDTYEKSDLAGAALLIDLGGNNKYRAPVAAAHEKQIRVVIDFGTNITIDDDHSLQGNAGAGIFGIGVLVLPNPKGVKEIKTAGFSQGVGVAGIGALIINGTAHLTAQRTVQGMGTFGVGILAAREGRRSTYVATRSGQGSALTRGVGLFIHEGDEADIKGGLVQPDPREPLGSVSLCQGVGFGPRAYAGGGVGIAVVKGNKISVKGSYFSQGVGYWHGFGVFRLRGDNNTIQARRYDMGSGVHSAFGHMDVFGNNNRILNWGVGPAYGWDHAIGSALVQGNDNEMQTEWGSGTASIGSLSFSLIGGERNKLKLCDFGTNNFFRDEPAYSVQLIDGLGNALQCQGVANVTANRVRRMRTPWGLFQMQGTALVENLGLTPPEWPELPREEAVEREMVDLSARLNEASSKPAIDEVSDLVDIAAAFSLDKATPRRAMHDLLILPPEKAALLINVLEPAAVDQLIYLSVAIPAHGEATTQAMVKALRDPISIQNKAVLINLLRMSRPTSAVPALNGLLADPSSEDLHLNVLRTMGALLNRDTGNEPGTRAALEAVLKNVENPSKRHKQAAAQILARLKFNEGFGLVASVIDLLPENREELLELAPEDLTGGFTDKCALASLRIIAGARKTAAKNIQEQLKTLDQLEPQARAKLTDVLHSTKTAAVNSAVIALGQISNNSDAPMLKPLLKHASARVRESAAVALARMGDAGYRALSTTFSKGSPRERALALAAATQTVSPKFISLIKTGLIDEDSLVRLTAVTAIENLPDALAGKRAGLIAYAKRQISEEKDSDVRLALQLLK